jgi:hypothetical protein
MTHEIFPFLLALALAFAWIILAVPLVCGLFGISLPLNPRMRKSVQLTPDLRILVDGLFDCAIPVFIFGVSDIYLQWAMYGNPSDQMKPERLLDEILPVAIAGVIAGMFSAYQEEKRVEE